MGGSCDLVEVGKLALDALILVRPLGRASLGQGSLIMASILNVNSKSSNQTGTLRRSN